MTPLMHASAGGKLEIVEYLLGQKVDINAKDLDSCDFFVSMDIHH